MCERNFTKTFLIIFLSILIWKYPAHKISVLIPVNQHADDNSEQQMAPVAAVVERVKENLQREKDEVTPHVDFEKEI